MHELSHDLLEASRAARHGDVLCRPLALDLVAMHVAGGHQGPLAHSGLPLLSRRGLQRSRVSDNVRTTEHSRAARLYVRSSQTATASRESAQPPNAKCETSRVSNNHGSGGRKAGTGMEGREFQERRRGSTRATFEAINPENDHHHRYRHGRRPEAPGERATERPAGVRSVQPGPCFASKSHELTSCGPAVTAFQLYKHSR